MTQVSSMSACTPCAGFTRNASFTSSTPSLTNTAPPRAASVTTKRSKAVLEARFDRIFTLETGFVTLDRLLKRLHKNKPELLMVLKRPEIPLHTNGSENDIRAQVTRRIIPSARESPGGFGQLLAGVS